MKNLQIEFEKAILNFNRLAAKKIFDDVLNKYSSAEFIDNIIVPSLERIGTGWENGSIALSQVYMSGKICEELVDSVILPASTDQRDHPKMAIAVFEDQHILGKRIVYSMVRASGFNLLDYGHMDIETLPQRIQKDNIRIILLSSLMLPSALRIKEVRDKIDREIKIVVGGAPFRFDDQLWQEVGADAMGTNAADAVKIVTKLSGEFS